MQLLFQVSFSSSRSCAENKQLSHRTISAHASFKHSGNIQNRQDSAGPAVLSHSTFLADSFDALADEAGASLDEP